VYWIVSSETAREGRHIRDDLVAPHIFIRKPNAQTGVNEVVACKALIHFNASTGAAQDVAERPSAARPRRGRVDKRRTRKRTQSPPPVVSTVDSDFDDDPGPTPEELDAREAALAAQYEEWADEDAQAAWVEERRAARESRPPSGEH
jgi:hypothetical protein